MTRPLKNKTIVLPGPPDDCDPYFDPRDVEWVLSPEERARLERGAEFRMRRRAGGLSVEVTRRRGGVQRLV